MADLYARLPSRGKSPIMPVAGTLQASLQETLRASQTVSRSLGGHVPLFRMIVDEAHYPECNFSVVDPDDATLYNRTLVTDGSGPFGRNYVKYQFIPQNTLIFDEAWGWALDHNDWFALDSCVQGDTRYYRYRFKYFTPFSWTPSPGGSPGDKFVDFAALGDNANPGTRCVHQHWGNRVTGEVDIEIYKGGGGGPGIRINNLTLGVWHNVTFMLKSGSTTSAGDGELHIYLDEDHDAQVPRASLVPIGEPFITAGWPGGSNEDSYLVIGSTTNSISLTSTRTFGITDFEYDNQFDPNWNQDPG